MVNEEKKFEIQFTDFGKKRFKKLPQEVKPRLTRIIDRLEKNPYIGDRICPGLWECRALRVYRVYYTIIEDSSQIELLGFDAGFGLVIMLDWSNKNDQQKIIDKVKVLLKVRKEVFKLK